MTRHPQYNRSTCYFCHEPDEHILESHHIVPRRHGGGDGMENIVKVCPTCHEKLERLYDARFYDALGVEPEIGAEGGGDNSLAPLTVEVGGSGDGNSTVTLCDLISEIEEEHMEGAPIEKVHEQAEEHGFDMDQVSEQLERLFQRGECYKPRNDRLRVA